MKKLHLLLLPLLLFCFDNSFSQSGTKHEGAAADSSLVVPDKAYFSFFLRTPVDELDATAGSLTRRYYSGTKTVNFRLTKTELQQLRKKFFQERLDRLPNDFYPKKYVGQIPSMEEKLVVYFDGKMKRLVYAECFLTADKLSLREVLRVKSFFDEIKKIVYQKPEIKSLPPSDWMFM